MREKSRVVWALALAVAEEVSSQTRMLGMRLVLGRHREGPTFKYPSTGSTTRPSVATDWCGLTNPDEHTRGPTLYLGDGLATPPTVCANVQASCPYEVDNGVGSARVATRCGRVFGGACYPATCQTVANHQNLPAYARLSSVFSLTSSVHRSWEPLLHRKRRDALVWITRLQGTLARQKRQS